MKRLSMLTCVLALALVAPLAASAEELPDSPAGKALTKWLEVLKQGDPEAGKQHYADAFNDAFKAQITTDQYMQVFQQVGAMLKDATIQAVDVRSETALQAYTQAAGVGWLVMRIEVEPDPPHKIAGLLIQPSEPPGMDVKPEAEAEAKEGGE